MLGILHSCRRAHGGTASRDLPQEKDVTCLTPPPPSSPFPISQEAPYGKLTHPHRGWVLHGVSGSSKARSWAAIQPGRHQAWALTQPSACLADAADVAEWAPSRRWLVPLEVKAARGCLIQSLSDIGGRFRTSEGDRTFPSPGVIMIPGESFPNFNFVTSRWTSSVLWLLWNFWHLRGMRLPEPRPP